MNRKKRKQKQKIKKTVFTLFVITLIIILLFSIKSCSKKVNIKDKVYGYVALTSNSNSKIMELHTIKDNIELDNVNNMIYGFTMKNNRLIYYIKNSNGKSTIKYIDLNDSNLSSKTIIENIELDNIFDITDKYLVLALQEKGVKKYDLKTGAYSIILDTIGSYDFFILDNKMYGTTYRYENKKSVQKYYTCTLDGYEFNWIEKEKYEELKNSKEQITQNNKMYLTINNKKVTLGEDNQQLLYNGEVIYSTNNNKIRLMYTEDKEKIAFAEYTSKNNQNLDEEYFTYDIKDKNISKVGKNSLYDLIFIPAE